MQATTIGAIAGGIAGVGAAAAIHASGRGEPAKAEAAARAEWEAWRSKLDREFPSRALASAGDEARFEEWLKEHPAPSWIRVEYRDLRAISIDPFDPVGVGASIGGTPVLAGLGGGIALALAGASVAWSSRLPSAVNGIGAFGQYGGAALALGLLGASFFQPERGGLLQEIESSEWRRPSKWYH